MSFSIIDKDFDDDSPDQQIQSSKLNSIKNSSKHVMKQGIESDSEENSTSPKRNFQAPSSSKTVLKTPSDISGRKIVMRTGAPSAREKSSHLSSESDQEESEHEAKNIHVPIPGEYNPKDYDKLDVDDDITELFQYITKYTPQHLTLDYKFKPFIPDFIPSVGDIDAFLKVIPPESTVSGELYEEKNHQLGLVVLDEPTINQSDPALLHLQLRAASNIAHNTNIVVKNIDNVEKNVKVIDKWIKDISDLHKTKSSPVVKYSEPMPDLDELMQEWPEEVESQLREQGFPYPDQDTSLSEYIDIVCGMFEIPVLKNKVQSLHHLFCLYMAVKNSQLYRAENNDKDKVESTVQKDIDLYEEEADRLILE